MDADEELEMLEQLASRQYRMSKFDWETELRIMEGEFKFHTQSGRIPVIRESFMVDGYPLHHLDVGPKNVKCLRRQKGMWLEGVHWRGHCPGLILAKEIDTMASPKKNEVTGTTKGQRRKEEVPTAKLSPKNHVADPEPTRTKSKTPRACGCDCGEMTNGGRFVTGHDSKLKSLFLKVTRGDVLKKDLSKKRLAMYEYAQKNPGLRITEVADAIMGG